MGIFRRTRILLRIRERRQEQEPAHGKVLHERLHFYCASMTIERTSAGAAVVFFIALSIPRCIGSPSGTIWMLRGAFAWSRPFDRIAATGVVSGTTNVTGQCIV